MIRFDEASERIGADAVRYLFAGANVASDVRFGFNLGDEARRKLLGLWNIYTFFETYADIDKPVIGAAPAYANLSDRWLKARIDDFVETVTRTYEEYATADVVRQFRAVRGRRIQLVMCASTAAASGARARTRTKTPPTARFSTRSRPLCRSWRRSSPS
jgi:leucyl-tRNA synthetase